MDEIRSLISTMKLRGSEQHDINAAIRHQLRQDRIPDPDKFEPTMDNPICAAPGRATADFERAYGVLRVGVGVTGPGLMTRVRLCDWDWFFDEDAARREAYCRLWQETDDGRVWLDSADLARPTFEDLKRHGQREIEVPVWGTLTLYRVPVCDRFFGDQYLWRVVVEKEDAIVLQRETIFKAWSRSTPFSVVIPVVTDRSGSKDVPLVGSMMFDRCPWTDEPIVGYASWSLTERRGVVAKWFPAREEAEAAHDAVFQWLLRGEEIAREKEELRAAREIYVEAVRAARKVAETNDFSNFAEVPAIAAFAEELRGCSYTEEEDGKTVDWYLLEADEIEALTRRTSELLAEERERRFSPWKRGALDLLKAYLLATQPKCLLCGGDYLTDEVIQDLVLYGEVELHCCGPHGLTADTERLAEGQTKVPEIVTLLERWAKRVRDAGYREGGCEQLLFEPRAEFGHYSVELGRVRFNGNIVIRFLVIWISMSIWQVRIVVEGDLLDEIQKVQKPKTDCCFENTFAKKLTALIAWWTGKLSRLVDSGKAAWLRLTNDDRHGWGARERKPGMMIAYKVQSPDSKGYDPGKRYLCHVVNIPEHTKKPGFELRIVRVSLEDSE